MLPDIENSMVANTKDAPWNQPDDNRRYEHCSICGRIMIRSDKDWQYPWVDEDEDDLKYAGLVPGSYVCSLRCRSQSLYEAMGPDKRKALETLVLRWEEMATALIALGVGPYPNDKKPTMIDAFYAGSEEATYTDEIHSLRRGADTVYELLCTEDPPAWVLALREKP